MNKSSHTLCIINVPWAFVRIRTVPFVERRGIRFYDWVLWHGLFTFFSSHKQLNFAHHEADANYQLGVDNIYTIFYLG